MSNVDIGIAAAIFGALVTVAAATGDTWDKEKKRPTANGVMVIICAFLVMIASGYSAWAGGKDTEAANGKLDAANKMLALLDTKVGDYKQKTIDFCDSTASKTNARIHQEAKRGLEAGSEESKNFITFVTDVHDDLQTRVDETRASLEQATAEVKLVDQDLQGQVGAVKTALEQKTATLATSADINTLNQSLTGLQIDHQALLELVAKADQIGKAAARLSSCSVAAPQAVAAAGPANTAQQTTAQDQPVKQP